MNKKTACLLSCSDHYGHRLHIVDAFLREQGFTTTYITSDFDHTEKKQYICNVPGCVQLHARPYRRNLSFARIANHREFARDAFRYLETLPREPDLVVALLPPNFLAHYAVKYKKRHSHVRLVFDIFDLWPESMPLGKLKTLFAPVFRIWANLRDKNLLKADLITTECDMFRSRLGLPEEKSATTYLCGEALKCPKEAPALREDIIQLGYVGAINNIIDIPAICRLIQELSAAKPVVLHIIGKGEHQDAFIAQAEQAGAKVHFYGAVYDDGEKQKILSQCHFGLNIMKPSVCVGLTMKSVDYFRHGLPIINSIPADSAAFVRDRSIGFQWDEDCAQKILQADVSHCLAMRQNVEALFAEQFTTQVLTEKYRQLYQTVL